MHCGVAAHTNVLERERRDDDRRHGHDERIDCEDAADGDRRHRRSEDRHRLARHALDDPLRGERAEERARTCHAEDRRVTGRFDGEARVDHECNARVSDAEQQLAAAARDDGEPHLVVLQLCHGRPPVTTLRGFPTATQLGADSSVRVGGEQVDEHRHAKDDTHVEPLDTGGDRDTDEAGDHAEEETERIRCDQLVFFHESWNGGGAHRVQHPSDEEQQTKGDEPDELSLRYRGNDGTDRKYRTQHLTAHQQVLAGESVGDETSQGADEEQWECRQHQPPQERGGRVPRVQVEQEHLGEPQ